MHFGWTQSKGKTFNTMKKLNSQLFSLLYSIKLVECIFNFKIYYYISLI